MGFGNLLGGKIKEVFEGQAAGIFGWVSPAIKGEAMSCGFCEKSFGFLGGGAGGRGEFRDLSYVEETTTRHRDFVWVDEAMDRGVA